MSPCWRALSMGEFLVFRIVCINLFLKAQLYLMANAIIGLILAHNFDFLFSHLLNVLDFVLFQNTAPVKTHGKYGFDANVLLQDKKCCSEVRQISSNDVGIAFKP